MNILICGLPNAGKTTYSQQFQNVIHVDEVSCEKGHGHMRTVCEMIIRNNKEICIEGVFPLAQQRKKLIRAMGNNYKQCIWLNTSEEECIKRENRGRNTIIITNSNKIFQPPTLQQGWDQIIIIKNNGQNIQYIKKEKK